MTYQFTLSLAHLLNFSRSDRQIFVWNIINKSEYRLLTELNDLSNFEAVSTQCTAAYYKSGANSFIVFMLQAGRVEIEAVAIVGELDQQ